MKKIAVLVALLAIALVKPAHAGPTNEIVYSSSHTATADTSATLTATRTYLYRIIVSSVGAGGTPLVTLTNGAGTTIAQVDGTAKGNYLYEAVVSSGLIYTTAGTTPPNVTFEYLRQLPNFGSTGLSPYSIYHSTGIYTTKAIEAGRAILKRVLVTKAGTAPSVVTIYDTNGATGKVVDVINTEAIGQTDYNVYISSGITFSSTGNPNVTFIYGRR